MNRYSIINKRDTHACMEQSNAGDWVPYSEYVEAMKWKEEDPRMLREQCRIGDVAFQHLHCTTHGQPIPDWVKEGLPNMYKLLEENLRLRAMMPNEPSSPAASEPTT